MDITVGAVGFLHVRDVVVRFHDGPVERVVVGDLLYTGQLLTLLAWLFEFVGKRARGVRLRDAIDDETSRATTAARDEAFDGTGAQSSQPSSSPARSVGGRVHRPVPVSRAAELIQPWLRPEIRPDHPKSRIPRAGVVRRSSSIQGVRRRELR